MHPGESLLTLQAACERLQVSPTTLWRLRRVGQLHTVHIGRRALVPLDDVERIAREGVEVVSRRAREPAAE